MIDAENADDFARRCIAIIRDAGEIGRSSRERAIATIWEKREWYFARYTAATDKRAFLRSMPLLCQIIP